MYTNSACWIAYRIISLTGKIQIKVILFLFKKYKTQTLFPVTDLMKL